ncbi:MAG: hypothetical protein HRU20_18230 [Pseudomonadales bacterium]|nr:hypothetical protein [Pseudomonadales bacterium]
MLPDNLDSTIWRELVSRLIKADMAKKRLKYEDLSQLLAAHGTKQSADNLRNKINRGILGADLYLQLLLVLNIKQLDRESILEILDDIIQT